MSEEVKKEEEQSGSLLYDLLQVFALCLTPILLLCVFVVQPVVVHGPSMAPTLHEGDLMAVQRMGYTPKQGDVVVLTQEFRGITEPIVKRVIATGGQTVDIDYAAGMVSVDGVPLDEPYINFEPMLEPWYDDLRSLTVPEGSVFVMGDNRNHSNDSRDVLLGTVDARRIIGGARVVLFPFGDFGLIK